MARGHWENVTMDVGEWLRRLGLGQYEAVFRGSEIDADVLPELEDQHLKDLGVSLGHRLKILRAIRELAAGEPAKEHPAPKPPQPAAPASQDSAERRHLTVMFCDLVGSPRAFPPSSTPRTGAISSAAISTRPRRRSRKWAAMSPRSSATASWRCSAIPSRRRTTPSVQSGPRSAFSARSRRSTAGTPARAVPS